MSATAPNPVTVLCAADLIELRDQGAQAINRLVERLGQDRRTVLRSVAALLGLRCFETADMQAHRPALDLMPLARCQQRRQVLLATPNEAAEPQWVAVLCNPFDGDAATQLSALARGPVSLALATEEDLLAYLGQLEARAQAMDGLSQSAPPDGQELEPLELLSLAALDEAQSPTVRLLNSLLYDALKTAASDVHLESTPAGMAVKYRVDGVLEPAHVMAGRAQAEQLISRLKVLAELDIGERRVPQDGSFRVRTPDRAIDLRVSIMPSVHGEDAVVRILDKKGVIESHGRLNLAALGFDAGSLDAMRGLVELPHGLLLVTGPTGSGKTTTLYAALAETSTGREKVITIEDPVEYQLPGVLQIPVNEKKGLSFATGLRSILRHDPDKIMVGEIRDPETAEIAVQAALTGHLVLSTVHANNVFDVFGRFTHMGLDPYALASALNGIWAQRLLRLNCPHCRRPTVLEPRELARLGALPESFMAGRPMRGPGCGDCRGTGYRGRRAVAEVLKLDDELREMIAEKQPVRRLKDAAQRQGLRSLMAAALDLVARGETTLDEVRRVALDA